MTQEEKAKAYDEALERFKSFKEKYYTKDTNLGDVIFDKTGEMQKDFESIFPQLAESEDERIRKAIIKSIEEDSSVYEQEVTKEQMLTYLEKQKEPHYTKRNELFDRCGENCDPKTVEEVNKRVDDIMNMPELSAFEQALTNFIGYWEDDEERWPSKFVKKHGKHILDMAREELQKEQKPAEWSEEDEKNLENIRIFLLHHEEDAWAYTITKLKSRHPFWKPTYEQLDALKRAGHKLANTEAADSVRLSFLYDHLKELM